ncbi:MAG: isoprenyl transferase [Firmicutes bacterium]|nr:isoprenyl transferase [Bacillota bacterium]MCL5038588.1 isoprenyl transferase [Bacillota bacterium]
MGWFTRGREAEKNSSLLERVRLGPIPQHVAIIMDGNGRWASQRNLPRPAGHRAGAEALRDVVEGSLEAGIGILTVYAFSTENWRRPKEEVSALLALLVEYIHRERNRLKEGGVRLVITGFTEDLSPEIQRELREAVEFCRDNQRLVLNLALNYGGRREILEAVRQIARLVRHGQLTPEGIDEGVFASHLLTAGLPDPDLLIRTGGENRLSNFLLWQLAYSELWMTPAFWPDFRRDDLFLALLDFQRRERRFGGLGTVGGNSFSRKGEQN